MSEVVITGTGVISALGHDVPAFWSGLCAGGGGHPRGTSSRPDHFAWWAGVRTSTRPVDRPAVVAERPVHPVHAGRRRQALARPGEARTRCGRG